MKQTILLLSLCVLFIACGNNEGGSTLPQQEEAAEGQNSPEEFTAAAVPFPELFANLEQQDTGFFAEAFSEPSLPSPIQAANSSPFKPEEISKFNRFLIYNGDSTRAIDPYSYNYLLVERGGKEQLVSGGPDTEVGLVDLQQGKRQRLLYFGPSYILLEARWKGRDTVLFAISEAIADDKISPEIWEIDLASMTKRVRRYPDTLTVDVAEYRNLKLDSARY